MSLEERCTFLHAPSTFHLCKTIILKNSRYQEEYDNDQFYPRNVIVITQFEGKLNSQRILTYMKQWQHDHTTQTKVSCKGFHYKFADEDVALALSGFAYNAITPFFMDAGGAALPIILSEKIVKLDPAYLWFSAGRIELKMGVSVADFLRYFSDRVLVVDC